MKIRIKSFKIYLSIVFIQVFSINYFLEKIFSMNALKFQILIAFILMAMIPKYHLIFKKISLKNLLYFYLLI